MDPRSSENLSGYWRIYLIFKKKLCIYFYKNIHLLHYLKHINKNDWQANLKYLHGTPRQFTP